MILLTLNREVRLRRIAAIWPVLRRIFRGVVRMPSRIMSRDRNLTMMGIGMSSSREGKAAKCNVDKLGV